MTFSVIVTVSLFSLFVVGNVDARLSCFDVPFLTRSEWKAGPPKAIAGLSKPKLSFYVIHHIREEPNCYDDDTCAAAVRSLQRRHQNNLTWVDVGFHFIIGENGKVYEGRGWSHEGAHSRSWNRESFGIGMIGDFTSSPPNAAAVRALEAWMNCGADLGYVNSNYYVLGHVQSQSPGHTICPGFGIFQIIYNLPRFCPFQNKEPKEKFNETNITDVKNFCMEKLLRSHAPRSAVRTYFYTCLLIIFLLVIEII